MNTHHFITKKINQSIKSLMEIYRQVEWLKSRTFFNKETNSYVTIYMEIVELINRPDLMLENRMYVRICQNNNGIYSPVVTILKTDENMKLIQHQFDIFPEICNDIMNEALKYLIKE